MADDITIKDGAGANKVIATREDGGARHHQLAFGVGEAVDFWPAYQGANSAAIRPFGIDPDGGLVTRGAVLTDEGTVRVNFANASLAVSIGTATFTNGSATVTGTGFLDPLFAANVGDYVKRDADAESAWAQIESIDSNTSLTLVASYGGTGGAGASSRAIVKPTTGTGGTISVASGVSTIACGTTAAVTHALGRLVDYAPLVVQAGVTVSQRIANQDIYVGAWHETATPRWYAWFRLNGTTNTSVICESGRNPSGAPSASEIESTTVTLPGGATTAGARRYRVEMLIDKCRFFVDGTLVAEHLRGMPAPHDEMFTGVRVVNGTTPASGTTVTVDYVTAINVNKLTMAILSDAENIVAAQPPASDAPYSVAGVITINTVLVQLDCSQLRGLSIQCSSMGTTGVVTPEWSNDATNWVAATILTQAGATAATFNAAGMWTTPVLARHFRLRLSTATTAGTTTLRVAGFAVPIGPVVAQPVSGTVTANIGTGALAAGANAIGDVGLQFRANATGAASIHHIVSAASTNALNIKASAGRVVGWHLTNTTASVLYVKLHNTAGAPTAGTGVVQTIAVPANGVAAMPVGGGGIGFATGIARTIVTGAADADATATTANSVVGDIFFA